MVLTAIARLAGLRWPSLDAPDVFDSFHVSPVDPLTYAAITLRSGRGVPGVLLPIATGGQRESVNALRSE